MTQDFPWLASQCEADKAAHLDRLPIHVQSRRWAHQDSQDRQPRGRDVAAGLSIGDKAMVSWRGRREAVVIEIRRSRIVVELTQPYGQTRIVDIAADRVEAHQ
jgi:hypothetical protein